MPENIADILAAISSWWAGDMARRDAQGRQKIRGLIDRGSANQLEAMGYYPGPSAYEELFSPRPTPTPTPTPTAPSNIMYWPR